MHSRRLSLLLISLYLVSLSACDSSSDEDDDVFSRVQGNWRVTFVEEEDGDDLPSQESYIRFTESEFIDIQGSNFCSRSPIEYNGGELTLLVADEDGTLTFTAEADGDELALRVAGKTGPEDYTSDFPPEGAVYLRMRRTQADIGLEQCES